MTYEDISGARHSIDLTEHNSQFDKTSFEGYNSRGIRVLFISDDEYMRFGRGYSYVTLFNIDDLFPKAYLDLEKNHLLAFTNMTSTHQLIRHQPCTDSSLASLMNKGYWCMITTPNQRR